MSFRVAVRGHSLRRIETAMQRSELSLLTALSGKQRSLIPDGQPVVLEIFVKEIMRWYAFPLLPKNDQHIGCQRVEERNSSL